MATQGYRVCKFGLALARDVVVCTACTAAALGAAEDVET
jgi:hypothetical protein